VSKNATTYTQRSLNACATEQHYDRAQQQQKQKQQQHVLYPTFQVSNAVKFQDLLASHAMQREINIQITRYTE
jgi:hypothetical protein